ncbi:MAG: ABC transporter permease, partial [Saprospiraceae bacterium]
LQTTFRKNDAAGRFRRWTVVIQFTASIILIISTLAFYQQLEFIQNKKLGFQPNQVIALAIGGVNEQSQRNSLRESIRNISGVESVCLSQSYPTADGESGYSLSKTADSESGIIVNTNQMSAECSDILNFNLLAGRGLPPNKVAGDTVVKIVINQYISDYLEWTPTEAIGKEIPNLFPSNKTEVVGVVENFHFSSLYQPIGPYVLHNGNVAGEEYVLVKTATSNYETLLGDLQSTFSTVVPQLAFQYEFMDESINTLYAKDRRLAKIILIFSVLAILVACLGLFGLATFMAEQRTKEIGIRKVLGASIENLVTLLSKEFLILVGIALVLAIPIGWYAMNQWLQGFAYRTELSWQMFMMAGVIALGIAFLTVSMQSLRVALVNPVDSLKDE